MRVHCKHCNYEWDTKVTKVFVTCPSCLRKIKLEESEVTV